MGVDDMCGGCIVLGIYLAVAQDHCVQGVDGGLSLVLLVVVVVVVFSSYRSSCAYEVPVRRHLHSDKNDRP